MAYDIGMSQSSKFTRATGVNGDADRPLTIALVVDTAGNEGNGTSNSALQYARELRRQGHTVRLVGIGSPEYPIRVHHIPLVSWIAAKQQMQFAQPDRAVFRKAFVGVDVVHVYLPFKYGRVAVQTAHEMGIPATAGFHLQPENVLYSAGPLRYIPGASAFIYWLFDRMLYRHIRHIHTPSHMIAAQLRAHDYRQRLHVISNGYSPRFTPKRQREPGSLSPRPFRIVASGRLASEKDHVTLIRAVALSRHAEDIELVICGTGPLQHELRRMAGKLLPGRWSIGFHDNAQMPELLRSCDLLVHPSIVDIESLSVLEGMASGLVPVIARSTQSAAGSPNVSTGGSTIPTS